VGVAVRELLIRLKLLAWCLAFSLSAIAGDAQKGFEALQNGDYQRALKEIRPLAERGDAWAQTTLGMMYQNGQGLSKDFLQAAIWYEKAALQDFAWAQFSLGYLYEVGNGVDQDLARAVVLYKDSAKSGFAAAQTHLGLLYLNGIGVENSEYQANQLFQMAADQGDAQAQYFIGRAYLDGSGIQKDEKKAERYLAMSAKQGNSWAQSVLGDLTSRRQDFVNALLWFEKAAGQNDAHALNNVGSILLDGKPGIQADPKRAELMFKKSIENGGARGAPETSLGWMYLTGFYEPFVAKDYAAALTWNLKGAGKGSSNAHSNVALIYFAGLGVEQNFEKVVFHLAKAVELHDANNDWILKQRDEWLDFKDRAPIAYWRARELYWSALRSRDDSYLERLKAMVDVPVGVEIVKGTSGDDLPKFSITNLSSKGPSGLVEGFVSEGSAIAQLTVNGEAVAINRAGLFSKKMFVPLGGITVQIVAYANNGLLTKQTVRLDRASQTEFAKLSFDSLNPTTRQVKANSNAIALIVGVAEYEKTAGAEFADKDAQVFYDYAHLKLGIPQNRIQTLVNNKADVVGLLTGVNKWLKRSVRQGESDVYIFFAGHGLASDDGGTAYLIPYDGAPDFLERTAISRDEVFREVSSVNPRSVTVFLDTCYSGDTRGESRLIAGRPLSIKLQEQSLPKGFTVLTAAGGDQIAKPLKEAQHGMFSYFLMKGMEGDADADGNNEITAHELHAYVRENVVQQSGGSQVPELQGDGERVLVRFR